MKNVLLVGTMLLLLMSSCAHDERFRDQAEKINELEARIRKLTARLDDLESDAGLWSATPRDCD